ncbi:S8 family peptidase [Granulicella arctica]|uniref:S8 family peptidase n=1 Tax=Granulicella arctica TaxID=940613 RepID=UPI0021E08FD7|nr:S8 family peptidase [Granulicella arctica]
MAEIKNYLLGYGERLTERLDPPKTRPNKKDPYSFTEAKVRLAPRLSTLTEEVDALPDAACPHDEAVGVITLHPAYLAKSYFPNGLFQAVGLEPIGSRTQHIVPDKGGKARKQSSLEGKLAIPGPPPTPTAEIFVAGQRAQFRSWAATVSGWSESRAGAVELVRLENVYLAPPVSRLQPVRKGKDAPLLEVVLHGSSDYVIEGFRTYMRTLDIRLDLDRRFQVDGLCFLGVRIPRNMHVEMAKYSFLRVAREMPRLRELQPATPMRSLSIGGFPLALPKKGPVNADLRVAVFDGGVPAGTGLDPWVSRKLTSKLGNADVNAQEHGLGVTSSVLFGSLQKGVPLPQPYAAVDHYRVLDENTNDPEGNYYDVLERITGVLSQKQYDFVNLSLGPEVAFDDNEVHLWTLKLDQLFADGKTFVTVAAGNTGEGDVQSGVGRIQSPSDAVNVLGVGASNSLKKQWKRAPYSSLGPGRSPGLIKPDLVAFGGSEKEPFWILSKTPGKSAATMGTSFSSPLALRTAIGIRTYLGSIVQPIALKSLLIHHSENSGHHCHEVGWGRIPTDIEDLIVCGPGMVHVLYQGTLEPGKYLRARIPVPNSALPGKVSISATFCYATETDPQDVVTYTRAGLDIKFRPDKSKRTVQNGKTPTHADTMPFFQQKTLYSSEEELRRDAHQWETCVKRTRGFMGTSLNDPVFDIHYNARKGGALYKGAKPIPYALVVTVHAKNVTDLYDRVSQRYRTQLEALRPVIQLPVRVN